VEMHEVLSLDDYFLAMYGKRKPYKIVKKLSTYGK
jgi:hypothetical protein